MIGISGTELMDQIQQIDHTIPIIILTAHGTVQTAVECMRKGGMTTRPSRQPEKVSLIVSRALAGSALQKENEDLHNQLNNRYGISNIISHSPEMEKVFDMVRTVARPRAIS